MSETFVFDVAYNTEFEHIEALRHRMLSFVQSQGRDYLPTFDIMVSDIPEQQKMTLKAEILYKSNWQQGGLKTKRRNKWICALKTSMAEVKVFGPKGDPSSKVPPTKYTQMPWEEFRASEHAEMPMSDAAGREPRIPRGEWSFTDRDAIILDRGQNVFDEADELGMAQPESRPNQDLRQRRTTHGPIAMGGGRD
ncbi:hypothetical protein FRC06_008379 [Ceratobasidium sp. 370]|nr:hypothetical protein FRC06_008379 [Ceratobasidium sp. 370]